jgi:hypothetical protein
MPDLIIKPQTGSGNSVILQDQGGAAILTTADSGVSQLSTPAGHVINMKTVSTSDEDGHADEAWYRLTAPLVVISSANGFSMSASARILIMATVQIDNNYNCSVDLTKHGTGITDTNNLSGDTYGFGLITHEGSSQYRNVVHMHIEDITGTTNDVTYGIGFKSWNTAASVYAGGASTLTTITAIEFAV